MILPWRRRAQRRAQRRLDALKGWSGSIPLNAVTDVAAVRFDDIRAEWLAIAAKAKSAVYYVDGDRVGSLADVRAALKDGKPHAVHMVSGEPGPELLTGPFGREDESWAGV